VKKREIQVPMKIINSRGSVEGRSVHPCKRNVNGAMTMHNPSEMIMEVIAIEKRLFII